MTTQTEMANLLASPGACAQLTGLQIAAGFVTWTNLLMVFALVIGTVSFVFLFGKAIGRLLQVFTLVPVSLYEIIGYALSAGLLLAPVAFDFGGSTTWFVVPGALLLGGLLPLTAKLHELKPNTQRYFMTLTVVWGAAAIFYDQPILGFAAVAAFMAFMGFSIIVTPLAYCIGFNDEKALNRAGGAGLLITILLCLDRLYGPAGIDFSVFRTGMEFLGPFVFALSILLNSSRWYMDEKQSWLGMQVAAVGAYFMLIAAGANLQIDALLNVGTGFMILWVLEKPMEIKQRSLTTLAATGFIMSLIIGTGVYWAQNNMEIVHQYLPLMAH